MRDFAGGTAIDGGVFMYEERNGGIEETLAGTDVETIII